MTIIIYTRFLREFRVDKIRLHEVQEVLEVASTKTKMKDQKNIAKYKTEHVCYLTPPQGFYFDKMKEYADRLPTVGLLPNWERVIKNEVPSLLKKKYPVSFNNLLNDTKNFHFNIMHEIGLKSVISREFDWSDLEDAPFKYDGQTPHRPRYLDNRNKVASKYFLSHKLIKNIFLYSYTDLPEYVCDFKIYKKQGYIDTSEFFKNIDINIKNTKTIMTNKYYAHIVKLVTTKRYFNDVPNELLKSFLKCASKLLALQIIKFLISSINHLMNVLNDFMHRPLLRLELKCENNELYYNLRKSIIYDNFHEIINKISNIGASLPTLESWLDIKTENDTISAIVPDWFIEKSHEQLTDILEYLMEPLNSYIDKFERYFKIVYDKDTKKNLEIFIAENKNSRDCEAKVELFNNFIRDINGMTRNEYLGMFILGQNYAKDELKNYAQIIRKHIIFELRKRHYNFNIEICNIFENIKKKALNIPDETKDLLELGKYMIYVTTILLPELNEKINLSLSMTTNLLEMINLDKYHLQLNNETVNWLENIKPIIEQSNSIYEQAKFEHEENLQSHINNINCKIEEKFMDLIVLNNMNDINLIHNYIEYIRSLIVDLKIKEEEIKWINNEEDLFGFPQTIYPRIKELKDIIIPFYELIYGGLCWKRNCNAWLDGPFEYLDGNLIDNKTTEYFTDFTKIYKIYRTKIKMQLAVDYPYTFSGSPDDPDPSQQPSPMRLCYQLLEDIKWFKYYVPIFICFCNKALRQRNWDEMSIVAGYDITPNAGTTIRKLINMNLMNDIDKYEMISTSASKELALKELLDKLIHDWDDVLFTTMLYKDSGVSILTQVDDIQSLLEEHIVKVQAMRGSAFVKPIENDVKLFYDLLLRIQCTIEEWTKVQVQWIYLLPIFSSKDIVAQLPEEGIMFDEVNLTFKKAMDNVLKEPHVRETAGSIGLYEIMKNSNELMEKINDGVTNYLEKKRLYFPRFFFLSNDDMLEILSETKDPLRVQPHLKKCFEGISKLGFNNELEIYSMFSDDNEQIKMQNIISTKDARGCVEKWLVQVEEQMINSIKHQIYLSYFDYERRKNRVKWSLIWPGQVILCVSQIFWCIEVQICLRVQATWALETYYNNLKDQMSEMVNLVKGKLTKQNRTTLNALITIDVHAQDVVKLLIDKQITDDMDFEWLAQLRYYWEDNVQVRIINATVRYAYEYLGNCPRLVITPLTDRCYRTLIGAYSLHLNGAPEGPAGTGKTETTKDLGRAIAVQCVVFNCSDGLDYKNMGKFFKGLASCGAWACFDEFNRIELEVLSVVAQQILCIVQAVRGNLDKFIFEGTELNLNSSVYVCITMNPGYAGRSELPDNLKVLFRTVAMMVPDYAMIGEIFLYSSGFSSARILSVKIVTTYKLCSEQLSSQSHYDYGMRAVKTVLTAAQNLKLKYPNDNEMILLLRSIIDVNLPKFLSHDVPLFEGIISDLFPGIELPAPNYDVLLNSVKIIADRKNLQPVDGFLLKIIQTYEMMIVRHGFMLVGDPFGGKTSVLHTLAEALTLMYENGDINGSKTEYTTINPKSITMGQLYGQFDQVSNVFEDGICPVAFRNYCTDDSSTRKWLIFDGPVDAVWIENLNTVLDDNKKLCLTSGEVMQMTNVMSMIFEVMDLFQASPATVSRCGMIYIESHVIGWRPFVQSWYKTLDSKLTNTYMELIEDLFEWLIETCLEFVRKKCKLQIYSGQINQVVSTLKHFKMFIDDAIEENPNQEDDLNFWIQASMILAVVWGIGGTLDSNSIEKFNNYYISLWKNQIDELPIPDSISKNLISLPTEGMIHDNYYTFKGKGSWKYFGDSAKIEKLIETQSIGQMIVPTIDTVKYQNLFLRHIKHRERFLIFGETGTGKSFYMQDIMMNKLEQDKYLPNLITFTANTTAAQAQELVISKLYKRKKGHYGPMGNSHCIVFIDDVNMPSKEIYGAQPAIELLRQIFDHGYWYDLNEPIKIKIFQTMFLCSMGPPGGSRQDIYHRFLRHFNLFTINQFSNDSIIRIFTNIATVGLKRNGFPVSINLIVNNLVNATLDIFKTSIDYLRPTPAKSHYLFNLRDFSRVITGCAMIKKDSVETNTTFTKLWVHEILRVFGDRLVDETDRDWLFKQIKKTVQIYLKETFDNVFDYLPKENDQITQGSLKSLIFGNFMNPDAIQEDRLYEEISSIESFKDIAMQSLDDYNTTHRNKMDIVPFRYALEHLARVCRILATPGGSLLMVGVGGSGRQSLTKLASSMMGYDIFQPEIGSTYGINEWRDDIKNILRKSGGSGNDVVFLFNEGQIKEDVFLSDIDSLLNSGEVPNLFTIEERQEIIEMCRLAAQGGNRTIDISLLSVLSYFVNRCKEKLHIMLCFSPIGDTFRTRLRMYPSLVNCCTIDWFEIWPEDALEQVAIRFTTDINVNDDIKTKAVIACKYFHICAKSISENFYHTKGRKTYITSAAFLDLIKTYAQLVEKKQEEIITARDRYLGGLDKLAFAAQQITIMKEKLIALKPELEISAKITKETMSKIEKENLIVEKATIAVKADEKSANIQAEIASNLKNECEADLAEALPILDNALAALNTLKPADISQIKTMKRPPEIVKLVLSSVCVMLHVQPEKVLDPDTGIARLDYWKPTQRILGDMKFLENLKDYDKDNIPNETIDIIKKTYINDPNFEPKIVAKASQAAEGLCKWVRAMVLYDKIAKIVAPKRRKLNDAQKEYEDTMEFLDNSRKKLADLNDKLLILKDSYNKTLERKIYLENQVVSCKNQLIRAEKLINGLGGEKDRWLNSAKNLQISYDTLPGDLLISCGMIAYLGPFTTAYRHENIEKWIKYVKQLNIPCSNNFDFVNILGTEIEINSWNIFGLPRDIFSTENAIIMSNSKRWSLFIDPQSQANKWIKNMEKSSELEVIKLTDKNYMNIIEKSIEYGKPVLIENIYEILDTPLDPIITKNIYKVGKEWYITLGEKTLLYDTRFRLYITTKLRNPHYLPEIFNKITLINFALTIEGLEDQLLGIVVGKERPDLQKKKEYLIIEGAKNRKSLKKVEDDILKTLSISGASILDDEDAIEILDSSKILSIGIIKKQEIAKKTEIEINISRQSYKPIATHSSSLYYTVTDLPNIDPMYQYSLTWFINLYILSIETANKNRFFDIRLKNLRDTFTFMLYENVCRSLFEKDKILYSFVLYTTILLADNKITKDELLFFLTGGVSIGKMEINPASNWLTDKSWDEIIRSKQLKSFEKFSTHFKDNLNEWKNFYDSMTPEIINLPKPWNDTLSEFQKLIILRMIRPDKVILKIIKFIENGMGKKFVIPPPFNLIKSYNDSNCLMPLIFILSTGSDPMDALSKFVDDMNYTLKFDSISLGQGQGPIAQKLIENAQKNGSWICLQNCHLAVSWMPILEKLCENFDHTNTNKNFRLWLTSYPSDKFPISVLQNGIKMTNEPPTGLQQNLMRSYTSEPVKNTDFFYGCHDKNIIFSKLLYGLCFFHALVQERRTFGPQGWNIKYGFNESDFQISVNQLQIFLNQYDKVPFKAILYLTGECNYGGRVTDDRDRRCLLTILNDFYNENIIHDENYIFSNVGNEYSLPKKFEYHDYIKQIEVIPMNPPPEVFGLHMNAGITRDLDVSKTFFDSMINIQGTVVIGDTSKQDELLLSLKNDIYQRLPDYFDIEEVQKAYPVLYMESMNTVLIQEMERYNKLLKEIRSSLEMLEKAIQGLIVMTPDLEILSIYILNGKIPPTWIKASAYPSLKPLPSFINDFIKRLEFFDNWKKYGKPLTFWISGFSFVHAFLTGATQNFARKYKISIDKIGFDYEVMPAYELNESPIDGVYVYGMYLSGAKWDMKKMQLSESNPKVLWDIMPIIWLKPSEITLIEIRKRYECPLYITSARFGTLKTTGHSTNYVLMIMLDTGLPVSHWIKRGLALLCQLDD
ncbi:dynein axonemal heavy chain 12 [Aphidius gifuensis]|uniref:dynein axonemal heavy chain 12 n=1 Tax=Aphidius gifuensis TaxID=684658 RepID=UPI001CDD4456|nr:dynein axonemal heavy chain 12 [Aphidius gifuensis]